MVHPGGPNVMLQKKRKKIYSFLFIRLLIVSHFEPELLVCVGGGGSLFSVFVLSFSLFFKSRIVFAYLILFSQVGKKRENDDSNVSSSGG